jgi:hypothetical protein
MTTVSRFWGPVSGMLLGLLLLTGCSARLQKASLGTTDVCLRLPSLGEKPDHLQCGYYAVKQLSQYYRPELAEKEIKTDSLLFVEANDTVSLLHCLKDNVAIPLAMTNGRVDGLLRNISLGDPVIVFMPGDAFATRWLNLIGSTFLWHCIVVVGHNADETELFFYSDGEGPYTISREVFSQQWARVDNLCIMHAR